MYLSLVLITCNNINEKKKQTKILQKLKKIDEHKRCASLLSLFLGKSQEVPYFELNSRKIPLILEISNNSMYVKKCQKHTFPRFLYENQYKIFKT